MRSESPFLRSGIVTLLCMIVALSSATAQSPDKPVHTQRKLVETYADIAYHTYADALAKAESLRGAIDQLIAKPTQLNLIFARTHWVEARLPYLQSEVFRFYGGPIDGENGPGPLLNGWPVDPAAIEGIIRDSVKHPSITKSSISALNKSGEEQEVTTGYHVIEFLLWGEDKKAGGPGARSFTDYAAADVMAARRAAYLKAAIGLVISDLKTLVNAWKTGATTNYRAKFLALPAETALQNILTGIAGLAGYEVAGRSLGLALESQKNRDEQSQFSDTTHLDVLHNTAGIANVLAGAYVGITGKFKVKGTGVISFAESSSPEHANALRSAINSAVKNVNAITSPFDQAIQGDDASPGRMSIKQGIESLQLLTKATSAFAKSQGIRISLRRE